MEGIGMMKKADVIIIIYVSIMFTYGKCNLTIATCASFFIMMWILFLLNFNNKSFRNWLNKPFNKK